MAFPKYTMTGRKNWKDWLENQLTEIESAIRVNPVEFSGDTWVPMYRELLEYAFMLEERLEKMELS